MCGVTAGALWVCAWNPPGSSSAKASVARPNTAFCIVPPIQSNSNNSLPGLLGHRGPHDALIFLRHRRHAFVNKLLYALPAVGFRRENVALRVRGDAVDCIELSRLPSSVTEAGQDFQRIAQHNRSEER